MCCSLGKLRFISFRRFRERHSHGCSRHEVQLAHILLCCGKITDCMYTTHKRLHCLRTVYEKRNSYWIVVLWCMLLKIQLSLAPLKLKPGMNIALTSHFTSLLAVCSLSPLPRQIVFYQRLTECLVPAYIAVLLPDPRLTAYV